MDEKIKYTSIEEQIEKLKSQNLIITDEKHAKTGLMLFGYSNLIRSYREPYMIKSNERRIYRSGVTFQQISSLYMLDKSLRNAVMASMQDLEEHLKESAADVIAKSFGVHQDSYLQYKNYKNKKKRKRRFSLIGILDTMKDTLNTDKEPIHHYMVKYGVVPPWILFKSIYFSTITNYIDLFKTPEQEKIAERLYDSEALQLPTESLCKLMMDTLFICIDYRNMSAHGGRIYNYSSKSRLRVYEIFGVENIDVEGFSKLLFLLSLFRYQNPYKRLHSVLEKELSRHCSSFPEDITYLGQILNINICHENIVWVSNKSNKYHFSEHCSGMTNAKKIDLAEAKVHGYTSCKKCCN